MRWVAEIHLELGKGIGGGWVEDGWADRCRARVLQKTYVGKMKHGGPTDVTVCTESIRLY